MSEDFFHGKKDTTVASKKRKTVLSARDAKEKVDVEVQSLFHA